MARYQVISSFARYKYLDRKKLIHPQNIIVTTDSDLLQYLEDKNKDSIDLWNYLSEEDIENNWNRSFEESKTWWGKTSLSSITYKEINIVSEIAYTLDYTFQAVNNTNSAIDKWLKTLKKDDEIYLCSNHSHFYANLLYIESDILDSVIRWKTETAKLKCHFYEIPSSDFFLSQYPARKRESSRLNLIPSEFSNDNIDSKDFVILLNPDFTEGEFYLLKNIPENIKDKLLLGFYSLQRKLQINKKHFVSIIDDIVIEKGEEPDLSILENELGKLNERPFDALYNVSIFQNPYLNFILKRFIDQITNCLLQIVKYDNFLSYVKPKIILFGHSMDPQVRVMIALARSYGIKTLTFIHGGIANKVGYKHRIINVDHYLVPGPSIKNSLLKVGQSEDSIQMIGNPKLSKIPNFTKAGQNKEKKIVTFITGRGGGFTLSIFNERINRKNLNEFAALINRRKDYHFNFKIHPSIYDYKHIYERLNNETGSNLSLVYDKNIYELIAESDIIVNYNYVSNATIEALLLNKPVLFFSSAVYDIPSNDSEFTNLTDWVVKDVEELENRIDQLANYSDKEINDLTRRGREVFLIDDNRNWNSRFWNLITEITESDNKNNLNYQFDERGIRQFKLQNDLHEYVFNTNRDLDELSSKYNKEFLDNNIDRYVKRMILSYEISPKEMLKLVALLKLSGHYKQLFSFACLYISNQNHIIRKLYKSLKNFRSINSNK